MSSDIQSCFGAKTGHSVWLLTSDNNFLHGNAEPIHVQPGGARSVRQDAPDVASYL